MRPRPLVAVLFLAGALGCSKAASETAGAAPTGQPEALVAPPATRRPVTPAPASTAAPTPTADFGELAGDWTSVGFGRVTIRGATGVYSATLGTGPGMLELKKTGAHAYTGTWGESAKRHGTLTLTASADGKALTGAYVPDPACSLGNKEPGPVRFIRR